MAVVLILSITVTALAVAYHADIVGWFNKEWSSSTGSELSDTQVQTITELTSDIGQSVTDNGITVTAESIVLGDTSIKVLFSVEASDEIQLINKANSLDFEYSDVEVSPSPMSGEPGVAGYGFDYYSVNEAENKIYLMLDYDM